MFKCEACSFTGSLNLYCKHIGIWHPNSEFLCGQNGCHRTYNNIKILKKHLNSHHIAAELLPDNSEITSANTFDAYLNCPTNTTGTTSVDYIIDPPTCTFIPLDDIKQKYWLFILSLYSDSSLDRKRAEFVASSTTEIIMDTLNTIKMLAGSFIAETKLNEFNDVLDRTSKLFAESMTEKSMLACLRSKNCYKDPQSITIDSSVSDTIQHRQLTLANTVSTVVKVDVAFLFKSFFELPGIFDVCMSYITELERDNNSEIKNVIQGASWKHRKVKFGNKIMIPFCLYHDDFEPGNTLGAKGGVQSLSSFFVHFPTLPPHIATSLENIFPILSCKTSQKKYGLETILRATIDEFRALEEDGIELQIGDQNTKVFFSLCLLLGDNKALNEMMGITQCFIKSGFCRICTCTVEETKRLCKEDSNKLRTSDNYALDLAKNDFKKTGIREECVFNQLPTFDIISCPSVDLMHDVFEGVCHFQMTKIILHFIENNLFTIDDLNNRKSLFDFGVYQVDNRSVDIQMQHLKQGKLKMSASETLCFTTYFSLMVGDLVPKENEIWGLYKLFLKILDILMQNSLKIEEVESLTELVEKNHTLYMSKFEVHLKPKHHFMVHYANLIRLIGPLKNIYTMKQEMYHRELKRYINQSYNRRNLAKSVLIKESLKFSSRLVERRGYSYSLFNREKKSNTMNDNVHLAEIKKYLTGEELLKLKFINEVHFKNMLFKVDTVIPIVNSEQGLQFCNVLHVLKIADNSYKIFAQMLEIERFDDHLLCYIIKKADNSFKMINFEDLKAFPQSCHKLPSGEVAVRPFAKL